jgi:hypothetical protein
MSGDFRALRAPESDFLVKFEGNSGDLLMLVCAADGAIKWTPASCAAPLSW